MEPETATDFTTEDKCPLCLGKPETIPLDIPDAPEKTSIENGSSPLISFPNRSHPRPPEVPADMDGRKPTSSVSSKKLNHLAQPSECKPFLGQLVPPRECSDKVRH